MSVSVTASGEPLKQIVVVLPRAVLVDYLVTRVAEADSADQLELTVAYSQESAMVQLQLKATVIAGNKRAAYTSALTWCHARCRNTDHSVGMDIFGRRSGL